MLRRLLVLVVFAAAIVGCKMHKTKRGFRVGSGCETMDESCAGSAEANLCRDGALAKIACKGPKGCVDAPPADVECDESVADEKDPCTGSGWACTPAKDALLECQSGSFVKTQSCASHACTITTSNVGGLKMTSEDCR